MCPEELLWTAVRNHEDGPMNLSNLPGLEQLAVDPYVVLNMSGDHRVQIPGLRSLSGASGLVLEKP